MSGRPALSSEASSPRLLVLDDGTAHEVFDVVEISDGLISVRSAFLFEVGEELDVRIEQAGQTSEASARVRAHVGPADARITELEISGRSQVSGAGGGAGLPRGSDRAAPRGQDP